jgi:hypothetical protein
MNAGKLLAIGAAITATLAVATSIWLDPPAENRARSLDAERIQRLNRMQSAINSYFSRNDALPPDLDALIADKTGDRLTAGDWRDTKTGRPFDYEIIDETSYRVCAIFDTSENGEGVFSAFRHNAGRDCFERKLKKRSVTAK